MKNYFQVKVIRSKEDTEATKIVDLKEKKKSNPASPSYKSQSKKTALLEIYSEIDSIMKKTTANDESFVIHQKNKTLGTYLKVDENDYDYMR